MYEPLTAAPMFVPAPTAWTRQRLTHKRLRQFESNGWVVGIGGATCFLNTANAIKSGHTRYHTRVCDASDMGLSRHKSVTMDLDREFYARRHRPS